MAWRLRLKLPSFEVTKRESGSSALRRVCAPRGINATTSEDQDCTGGGDDETDSMAEDIGLDLTQNENDTGSGGLPEPSIHEIKEAANAESWGKIRSDLLCSMVKGCMLPKEQCCSMCTSVHAEYRCVDCGPPTIYYCTRCLQESHTVSNILHTPEVWEVSYNSVQVQFFDLTLHTGWNVQAIGNGRKVCGCSWFT